MPLGTLYKDLITEIVTQLKTITPELADDTTANGGPRVTKWMSSRSPRVGRYEAEVKAGHMTPITGFTTKSSVNEFQIMIDLIYYSSEVETGFDNVMSVAERIYDKFARTDIGGLIDRKTNVSINPGDGQLNRGLLAIPIRVIITTEKTVTQT